MGNNKSNVRCVCVCNCWCGLFYVWVCCRLYECGYVHTSVLIFYASYTWYTLLQCFIVTKDLQKTFAILKFFLHGKEYIILIAYAKTGEKKIP